MSKQNTDVEGSRLCPGPVDPRVVRYMHRVSDLKLASTMAYARELSYPFGTIRTHPWPTNVSTSKHHHQNEVMRFGHDHINTNEKYPLLLLRDFFSFTLLLLFLRRFSVFSLLPNRCPVEIKSLQIYLYNCVLRVGCTVSFLHDSASLILSTYVSSTSLQLLDEVMKLSSSSTLSGLWNRPSSFGKVETPSSGCFLFFSPACPTDLSMRPLAFSCCNISFN